MVTDTLTAIFKALGSFAGILKPYVDDHVAQKYENEFKARIAEGNRVLNERNPEHINAYVNQLLESAGYLTGGDVGENISVPLARVRDFFSVGALAIRQSEVLANLQFKQIEGK